MQAHIGVTQQGRVHFSGTRGIRDPGPFGILCDKEDRWLVRLAGSSLVHTARAGIFVQNVITRLSR